VYPNETYRQSTVLIVDDQPVNIQSMSKLLAEDYHIQIATNGAKALDIAAGENPPDLILLDIMMPEMDGYEVCRRLKANEQTRSIPVIFVTAMDTTEDEEKGLSLGAVDYISKPFQPGIVRARVRNQTERKRAEDALLQLTERLSLAVLAGSVGIWDLDVVNNVLTWDDQMFALYGITREKFGGTYEAWQVGVHPDDRMMVDAEVQMALRGEKEFDTEFRVIRPDGSIRNIRALASIQRDISAKPLRMIGTNWDITSRKQAEEAIRLVNNKLNLLSGITRHDIKNKVITIQGFLRFARKAKNLIEIQPFLDKIQDSAKAIEHQIDFSKNYQDLGVKSPRWLNLSNMIVFASNPAIHIFDETGTLQIFADPLFEKVLGNLIDNTIRHGETATEVRISIITDKDDIRIIWVDNGVGVLTDHKEMIFTRGFGKNTGFGLFLIREILAITGMTIQETGEPGKGARFEITVPNGKWRKGETSREKN